MDVLNINQLKQRWINGFTPNAEDYGDAFDALLAATNIVGSVFRKEYTDLSLTNGVFDFQLQSDETLVAFQSRLQSSITSNPQYGVTVSIRIDPDPNNAGMSIISIVDCFRSEDPSYKLQYNGDLELFKFSDNTQLDVITGVSFTGSEIVVFDNVDAASANQDGLFLRATSSPTIIDQDANSFNSLVPINNILISIAQTVSEGNQGDMSLAYEDNVNPQTDVSTSDRKELGGIDQTEVDFSNTQGDLELLILNAFIFKKPV